MAAAARAQAGDDDVLLRVGVIADVQHADIADGASYHGVPRFYRAALVALRRACAAWAREGVGCALHLGDLIDGFQAAAPGGVAASEAALANLLDAFSLLDAPTHHLIGNHDLYNLPRQRLHEALAMPATARGGASYYSLCPHPAWRFIMLDTYDISVLGWPRGHPRHEQAAALLDARNPNTNKNQPDGLVGVARRHVMFGGGVSDEQLGWLDQQLQVADSAGQCAIVCSHLPLHPDTCPPACLAWNYEALLAVLARHAGAGVAVATIAGHTHQNGYTVDDAGVHHIVLPGVVETPPGRDAYGVLELTPTAVRLRGTDVCMSCVCKLPPAAVQRQRAAAAARQDTPGTAHAGGAGSGSSSDLLVEVLAEEGPAPCDKAAGAAAASLLAAVRIAERQ